MNNLLHDPIFGIQSKTGVRNVSLPEALALLSSGDLLAYTGQRPHQVDVWHVFTVQLAAAILARHPEVDPQTPPRDPDFWEKALLNLAGGQPTAWHLVVDDVTKPAFMQHPLSSHGELEQHFKPREPKAKTPDELDVLVTAKNHDLKMTRIPDQDAEAWVYAVITYQTTSGFLGNGNYGVIRMNGGFASRPMVSLVSSLAPAARFREELKIVCDMRAQVVRACCYKNDGIVLTWRSPWTRSGHQFNRTDLDPWFIEAARPLRLIKKNGSLIALGATSRARQIGPKEPDGGDVGDPWIPIQTDNKKKGRVALSVTGRGWHAELLCNLLFRQGCELTPLQETRMSDGPLWFVGSVLVRGQGTTEGFHHVELPIPPKAQGWLAEPSQREKLAHRAQEFLKASREVEKALRFALITMGEGGPANTDIKREGIAGWVSDTERAFNQQWQVRYFPALWALLDEDDDAASLHWVATIRPLAERLLDAAPKRMPILAARYYRAICRAHGAFFGKLKKSGLLADVPMPEEEVVA